MTTVTRIQTVIVDPPMSMARAARATRQAAIACGPCPEIATLTQLALAVDLAQRELDHVLALWDRWCRRHGRYDAGVEHGPLSVRFCVARELLLQRGAILRLLMGPTGGSA